MSSSFLCSGGAAVSSAEEEQQLPLQRSSTFPCRGRRRSHHQDRAHPGLRGCKPPKCDEETGEKMDGKSHPRNAAACRPLELVARQHGNKAGRRCHQKAVEQSQLAYLAPLPGAP
eukprot:363500-Chlamydomonas_euryale.AAC.3